MDTEASAVDHPDPTIIDFVENSGLVPPGKYTRFERLPGGVSSDIWLVHADDRSFCVKRALAQLRVAADWRAPIERNTKEAAWIKAVAGFLPEAVPSVLAEDAAAGMFAMGFVSRASPVQTAVRNCTRDEGGPFGFGDQVADPKPPQAAVVKSHGGERCGNAGTMIPAGTVERGERKRTVSEVSKAD